MQAPRARLLAFARGMKRDVHAAWIAARHPRTPLHARAFGLLVTAYALSPVDLIPDFIPVLGLLDDAILVPLGIWLFVRMLPAGLFDECRARAERSAARPQSRCGIVLVVLLWAGAAWLAAYLLGFRFG